MTAFFAQPKPLRFFSRAALLATLGAFALSGCSENAAQNGAGGDAKKTESVELLNVSYDVSRDFYKEYNPAFIAHYQAQNPDVKLTVRQSHGGSSKQAQSINQGLQADVATMNQGSDIELLVKSGLVADTWQSDLPNRAVPFTSAVVFLVRQGNPKNVRDWDDLTRPGVELVIANPKTSGNGRYVFLGAYGYALQKFAGDKTAANDFGKKLLGNVTLFENGGRAATTTYAQRQIGDVLLTFENEAHTILEKFPQNNLQIVYPSYTVAAENPVAIVKAVSDKKGTSQIAHDYLAYLWSEEGQDLAARLHFRPSDEKALAKRSDKFPSLNAFRPTDVFGSWDTIMNDYFKDGGVYDTLVQNRGQNGAP